jgi:hypothetical protein
MIENRGNRDFDFAKWAVRRDLNWRAAAKKGWGLTMASAIQRSMHQGYSN